MARFLVVPQWQGSPSTRPMLQADGAEAIAGDLPRAACRTIDVPLEAGETLDTGIRRYSSLRRVQDAVAEALADADAIVVGGDCGVAVPAVSDALARHPNAAVVWFDAHADLHTAASSTSGAFAGMALRAAAGDGALGATHPVRLDRVVLAGTREFDPAESDLIAAEGITVISVDADPDAFVEAVAATGADAVYLHVDLDVLDPAEITGLSDPVPFGMTVPQLTAAITALRARFPLAGASLAAFAPASPAAAVDDMGAILRIVGALA